MRYRPFFLLLPFMLPACAMQQGDFPSLAKRSYEDGGSNTEIPSAPPADVVIDLPPAVQGQVEASVSASKAAHAKFLAKLPSVRRQTSAARGAAMSSERWVEAQMALAALEMERVPSTTALADLDRLFLEQSNREFEQNTVGASAIIARHRAEVAAQVDTQNESINALKAGLR